VNGLYSGMVVGMSLGVCFWIGWFAVYGVLALARRARTEKLARSIERRTDEAPASDRVSGR
jgi:hypothetical protein